MALNLACLNSSLSSPPIPSNNSSLNGYPSHSDYDSNGKALAQRISSSLARSTFSNDDIESFLNEITGDSKTWDASSIVNVKPVKSLIIYGSITLALFLILSIVFCAMSCCNCCLRKSVDNRRQRKKGKRVCQWICTISIFLIALLVVAQMIYICIQVNRTETYLKNSIDQVNHEILPKDIRNYLNNLVNQLNQLSSYTTQANSPLVQAAQAIFTKAFQHIFQDAYFLNQILEAANNSSFHVQDLGILINQSSITTPAIPLAFQKLQSDIENIFNQLNNPVQELCSFANGSDSDINQMIIDGLEQVNEQLVKLTNTIKDDIITELPSEDSPIIDKNLEDQIEKYSRLIIIILTVLIVLFGFIPLAFLILTCLCGLCRSNQESDGCSNKGVCCTRIFILPMFIAMIVIILVSIILYVVDLGAQSTCRTVHENQPFLVSFLTDEFLGENSAGLSFGEFNTKETINNVIEDCKNQVHFTGRVLETYLAPINNKTEEAMNKLNKQIYDKFTSSITAINILLIRQQLQSLNSTMSSINIPNATNKITEIDNDLKIIEERFNNISADMPKLPVATTNSSIYDFRKYLNDILNATLDRCPLPLTILYKADTLVCHDLAVSINGIWLNLFIYLFLIVFGLCILGLCTCRRSKSVSSKRNRSTIKDDYSSFTF